MAKVLSLAACIVLALSSTLAAAQFHSSKNEGVPNWDLYGGYSYVFGAPGSSGTEGGSGWDVSLKVPIFHALLGIKGDVSGYNSKDSLGVSTKHKFFLIGPQVGFHILGTSTLWLHGLLGSSSLSSSALPDVSNGTTFALAVGGGLDAGMSRHLAWRVTGDFYNTHYSATSNNVGEIKNSSERFSTGPIFRF